MFRSIAILCALGIAELHARPLIMSHRAGMGHFPQGSPAALQYSIKLQVDFIELDVRLSADGVPVVYHDQHINPRLCTLSEGLVLSAGLAIEELTVAQLKQFLCGVVANPEFPGQRAAPHRILTLKEAFAHAQDTAINFMLELKRTSPSKTVELVRAVLATIVTTGMSSRVNLQSSDPVGIGIIRKITARLQIPLIDDIVAAPQKLLKPLSITIIKRLGKRAIAYVINEPQQWERLLAAGVDGFITDYPLALKQYLARRAYRFSQYSRLAVVP